jgi:hypothetical protein
VRGKTKTIYEYFNQTTYFFSKSTFYISRGINFQDIPPKNSSLMAIDEDLFFEALSFAFSQSY